MTRSHLLSSAALLISVTAATSLYAQDDGITFSADFAVEIEDDFTFESTDDTAELNDLFATVEGAFALRFGQGTSINSTVLFEPIVDATDDREFEDHGLFVEELYIAHDFAKGSVLAGKFDPAFGFAWDVAPGLYGADFAEDYELTERLGVSASVPFGLFDGEAEVTASLFMADRTFLSDSVINSRGNASLSDGGVSNTNVPTSFALTLYGETASATTYNLGFRIQDKAERGGGAEEYGIIGGVGAPVQFGEFEMELLAEAAFLPKFDGGNDAAAYLTIGAATPVGPVTLSTVYSLREIENAPTDHLITASAEMEIYDGVTGAVGYRFGREASESNHTIGAVIAFEFGY
jgi:hypothetical protein